MAKSKNYVRPDDIPQGDWDLLKAAAADDAHLKRLVGVFRSRRSRTDEVRSGRAGNGRWQEVAESDASRRRRIQAEVDEIDRQAIEDEQRHAKVIADIERARTTRTAAWGGSGDTGSLRHGPTAVVTTKEVPPYGEGSSYSGVQDIFLATVGRYSAAIPLRGDRDFTPEAAQARLERNDRYVAELGRRGTDRQRELIRQMFVERNRRHHGTANDRSRQHWSNFVVGQAAPEVRDVSTGSMAFSPPIYMLENWVPYLTAAAPVARAAQQFDLPATGMVWDVPRMTGEFDVEVQSAENDAVASSSPTATYATADVQTLSGSALVSTQTFDRTGPGFQLDQLFMRQAARKAATELDVLVIQAALVACQNVVNTASSPTTAQLFSDVGYASSLLSTSEGTRLNPDSVFVGPSNLLRWFTSQLSAATGLPIFPPQGDSQDATNGLVGTKLEGYTGFTMGGARLFSDDNFGAASAGYTGLLVGDFCNSVYVATAPPILDVWPEGTDAATLTATVTFRSYCGVAVVHPSGVCAVTSSTGAYPSSPTWSNA